jgi:acyl CoA:acetate/3-ketoacid CoA transferase beta subunit
VSDANRATLAEVCAVACAEAWRGDGEILASPIGLLPSLAARLARATFAPDLLLTDGIARLVTADGTIEGWMPYRRVFDVVWSGRRHVMMGASQIDRFGNQNIAQIGNAGDPKKPERQLVGVRGAPGNTICHPTSYWIPNHSVRTFVPRVDYVCGIGYDRAAELGAHAARFHEIRRVVTNLGVFDFETPDRSMRLRSVHPGVTESEVVKSTGFPLTIPAQLPETRTPTDEELRLIREVLDPKGEARDADFARSAARPSPEKPAR